jgi:hypothetical protein
MLLSLLLLLSTLTYQQSELARCPEWSNEDVSRYVLVTIKISGIVSLICTIYFFGAIAVGEVLRQNLKNYKSEYI